LAIEALEEIRREQSKVAPEQNERFVMRFWCRTLPVNSLTREWLVPQPKKTLYEPYSDTGILLWSFCGLT